MKLSLFSTLLAFACLLVASSSVVSAQDQCESQMNAFTACTGNQGATDAESVVACFTCLGNMPADETTTCSEAQDYLANCGCGDCSDEVSDYIKCAVPECSAAWKSSTMMSVMGATMSSIVLMGFM